MYVFVIYIEKEQYIRIGKKIRKVKGYCEMEFVGKECFVNICIDFKVVF